MLRRVARLSSALAAMSVGEGDRVVIFAANSPEWHVADMAVMGLGAVVVPIYFRESAERIEYIVNHAGAKVVFASGAQQVERLRSVRGRLAGVERVVVHVDGDWAAVICARMKRLVAIRLVMARSSVLLAALPAAARRKISPITGGERVRLSRVNWRPLFTRRGLRESPRA